MIEVDTKEARSRLNDLAEQQRQASLTDLQTLEEFVAENADLEHIEARISEFNVFEAIGMTGQ